MLKLMALGSFSSEATFGVAKILHFLSPGQLRE
jgi:hypothetical protein